MAEVLIPVVIDIDGAFEAAAKRVGTAMKPLQYAIDKETADIQVNIGYENAEKELMKLSDLLKKIKEDQAFFSSNTHFTMDKLQNAIRNTKKAYDDLSTSIAHNNGVASPDQRYRLSQLQEVIILLEQEYNLRTRASKIVDEEVQHQIAVRDAIDKGNAALSMEANTIEALNRKISALRGKLDNIAPESQEWMDTAREIRSSTVELEKYKKTLDKILNPPQYKRPPIVGSIDRINHEMAKLEKQWNAMGKSVKFDADGKLSAKAKELVKKYQDLAREAERFGQSLKTAAGEATSGAAKLNTELGRTESRLKSLITRSAYFFSLHTVLRFLQNVKSVTAEFELQRVALGGIIQDTDKAESLFRQIKTAAIKSPFEIKDLVRFTKELSAYRIETDKLFDVTMRLADVSAGLGVDMKRLTLAYGQVRAAAVLRGQELRQFTEAGIPLVELLAKKFSDLRGEMVTTGEVFELISKRAVPFKMIAEIFEDMTDKGGMFYKMQEKQAETLAGQWANLRDALSIMYDEIGNTKVVHSAIEGLIADAKSLMNNWRTIGRILGYVGAQFAAVKIASLFLPILTTNTALAEKATTALAKAEALEAMNAKNANIVRSASITNLKRYADYMNKAAVATTAAGRGLKTFLAGFLGGGWIGAVITALTVVVGLIVSAVQESKRLAKELDKIDAEGSLSINRSASNFKRLADAAVEAADGSKEQNKALAELQRTYGDILPSQDNLIEKLRELKGNYTSLTSAIREKINMQMLEQKVNATTDFYSGKLNKARKKAKDYLKMYGLDAEQINAVMDEIQNAVDSGLITIDTTINERKNIFASIIKDLTGISVHFGNFFKDYEGNLRFVEDSHDIAFKSLNAMTSGYVTLHNEIEQIDRSMKSKIGLLGVYSKSLEETQRKIDDVTLSFKNKYSFEEGKEEARQKVQIWADALTEAFKEAKIDVSGAFENGMIDFTKLMKSSDSNKQLQNYVSEIQKAYEGVIPTNKMIGVVERMAQGIADKYKLSMDDIRKYLLQGDKSMRDYVKDLKGELHEAEDAVSDYELRVKDAKESGHLALMPPQSEIDKAKDEVSFLTDLIAALVAYDKAKKESAYVQDPFIKQTQERMKFMKDFQKGYEDLGKYLTSDVALDKELDYMRQRGLSLGISPSDQIRAARGLSDWYQETLDKTFDYLKQEKGVKGNITEFLSKQITGNTNRDKMLKDFQSFMQSLFDAKTDFDVSEKKKEMEKALSDLANQLKQSEQAKNFYNDILGLTGDKDLAANLSLEIYGSIGDDFKKRIQDELKGTFDALSPDEAGKVSDVLKKSIESGDIKALMAHINELPEKMAEAVRKAADATEKYNADIAKSYAKLLMQFDELKQQEVDITNKANKDKLDLEDGLELKIAAMRARNATEEEIEAERARVRMAKYNIDADTKARLNALSSQYRLFFNTVDVISIESARKIAAEQKELLADQLAAQKITFKEYQKEIKAINDHLKKYENKKGYFLTWITEGLDGLLDKIREEADSLNGIIPTLTRENFKDGIFTPNEETEEFLTRYDKLLNKGLFSKIFKKDPQITLKHKIELAATQAYNQAKAGGSPSDVAEAKAMAAGLEALGGAAAEMGGAAADGAEAAAWIEFWIKNAYQTIKGLDDRITKGGEEEASEIMNFFAGPLRYIAGKLGVWDKGDETWDKLAAVNTHAMDFVEAMKNGDFGNALFAVYDALYDLWGPNQRKIKREIKEQSNLIDDLEYEYSRLEVAVQKAFGSDYISDYNQQLTVLQAKAEAYRKQAELERSKEKKADEDTAKGYEKSAREIEDQIADMQSQLSEFFSGTDVTSAAKDFAKAWIDAYQEFGSTTDAMKEKFNDMIEEMVINSLAARLVQGILKPIFDQIDEAAQDGALTAQEIANISAMVPDAMAQIDAGMTGMVNELTAAGVNLRQQAGTFTGISRDIASASEESINGLAAGINTQNFYISHIDQNVALILSVLTGGTTTAQASVTGQVADPYKDQMLEYAALMPDMHDDLRNIYNLLNTVIRTRGETPTKVLHTNL